MGVFEDVIAQSSRKPAGLAGVIERRSQKRMPMLRTSSASLTSHLWELELVPAFALNRLSEDIDALAMRSLDKNIFFESAVLRSAWPRLTNLLAPRGVWMMCLWETQGDGRTLRMFMPVRINKIGIPRKRVLQVLSNEYMPLGVPLLDADCAGEAAETLLRLLADPKLKLPSIIDFTHLYKSAQSFQLLEKAAQSLGLNTRVSATHERAALIATQHDDGDFTNTLGKKRLRELARQRRKLEETGEVTFETAWTEDDVLDSFEGFMTLELKGWKGRRGTALYNHKKIASFSRQIVAELASQKGCQIFSMKHGNKIIGALIMLGRDGRLVPWKMAFDEKMATYSPGMQIMLEATSALSDSETFVEADSLATADHWMMNRIWPDRITITDIAIELRASRRMAFEDVIKAKERYQRLKSNAKEVLQFVQSIKLKSMKLFQS